MNNLTPNRPYLLRAYYDWLIDNGLTPHVLVDATVDGTQVPQQFVKEGQIVLNVHHAAVAGLELGNDWVEFNARFGGVPQQVILPMKAISAIYARENGVGVVFEMEPAYETDDEQLEVFTPDDDNQPKVTSDQKDSSKKQRGHLTIIK